MASDETLGSLLIEIGIEASGFQGQMSEISRRMGMAKAEFMAVGGSVKGFENTTQGAASKARMLTEQIELQKAKVALLENEYRQAADGLGANSRQAQDLKMKLDGTRGEVVKLQSSLNSLGNEEKITERKTKDLRASAGTLGNGMKSLASGALRVAASALTAVAVAAGAAIAGAIELGKQALETADETQKLADVTGHTAEEIQIMAYQGKALGVEVDTMTGAQSKLTKTMEASRTEAEKHTKAVRDAWAGMNKIADKTAEVAAQHGNHKKQLAALNEQYKEATKKYNELRTTLGPVSSAYAELGIKTVDSTGKLRDAKTVMQETVDALGKVKDQTERDALAQQIFGKSAMELEPLMKAGSAGLKALEDQARSTGAIMSNDAVAGLDNAGDAIDGLKASVTGIVGTMLNSFMPQINSVIGSLQGLAAAGGEAAKSGDWSGFIAQASTAFKGLVDMALGMLPGFIDIGVTILTTLIGSIMSAMPTVLPKLISGVLQLVTALVGILSTQGPQIITAAISAVGTLVKGLLQALPLLLQAAIQIVLALVNGLAAQLPTLIPAAVSCILTLVQTLVNNLPMLIDAAIGLVLALVDGVIKSLPLIIAAAPEIIMSLVSGIVGAIPKLLDAALKIITSLIDFMPAYFPMLIEATPQILSAIVTGLIQAVGAIWQFIPVLFTELWNAVKSINWGELGENILNGLVDGIKSVGGNVWAALKNIVSGAVDSFKRFFGIASPSKYMRDQIGIHLGGGIAEGILGSSGLIGSAMSSLKSQLNLGALSFSGNLAYAGAGAGGYGGGTVNNYNGHSITMPVTYNDKSTGWMSPALKEQFFREFQEFAYRDAGRTGKPR